MEKKFMFKPIVIALTLILTFTSVLSLNVSANSIQVSPEDPASDPEIQAEVEKGLELEPYITNNEDGTINFNSEEAISNGIDEAFVRETAEIYTRANEIIISQNLKSNSQNNQIQAQVQATSNNCGGSTYLDGNVFSGTLYLNSCDVTSIVAILGAGGSVAQLAHFIPVYGSSIAIITGVLTGLGASVLTFNNRQGNGIAIKLARNPLSGKVYPYWISSQ